MPSETTGLHVNPSDETIRLGPLAVRFLLTGDDSTGSVAAFELAVPAAQRLPAPAHSHDHYEETIYGIDGVLTWTVDGTPIDVGPGQALCIPRGAIHRFDNNGSQDVKALCLVTPAALGPQYFREAAEVMNAGWATGPRRWPRSCAATASRRLRPRLRRSAPGPERSRPIEYAEDLLSGHARSPSRPHSRSGCRVTTMDVAGRRRKRRRCRRTSPPRHCSAHRAYPCRTGS